MAPRVVLAALSIGFAGRCDGHHRQAIKLADMAFRRRPITRCNTDKSSELGKRRDLKSVSVNQPWSLHPSRLGVGPAKYQPKGCGLRSDRASLSIRLLHRPIV